MRLRPLLRFLATCYRRAAVTLAAVLLLFGWVVGAGAEPILLTDGLTLDESLNYQVLHNGIPVGSASTGLVVTSVKVDVGASTWCNVGNPAPGCATAVAHPWDLGTGIILGPGQTLVLTQTGGGFNFDTSDACPAPAGCAPPIVTVNGVAFVDQTFALAGIVAPGIFDPVNSNFNEGTDWVALGSADGMAVSAGYADSLHLLACRIVTCVPNPFAGGVTVFFGAPGSDVATEPSSRCGRLCFDAGAILITARAVPEPATWLLMALGLGVFGVALRPRRRR